MATPTPQLMLFLREDGTIGCEQPSLNGTRSKIAVPQDRSWPPEVLAALLDQRDRNFAEAKREKAIADREALAVRKRIFSTTWERHGRELAETVVPTMKAKREKREGMTIDLGKL